MAGAKNATTPASTDLFNAFVVITFGCMGIRVLNLVLWLVLGCHGGIFIVAGAVFARADVALAFATFAAFDLAVFVACSFIAIPILSPRRFEQNFRITIAVMAGTDIPFTLTTLKAFEHAFFITRSFIAIPVLPSRRLEKKIEITRLASTNIAFTLTTPTAFDLALFLAGVFIALLSLITAVHAGANIAFALTTLAAFNLAVFVACGFAAIVFVLKAKMLGVLDRLVRGNLNLDKSVTLLEPCVESVSGRRGV